MRDLKADLELCNRAIPCLQNVFTEWDGKVVLGFGVPGEHVHQLSENEYSLIAQASEGWPHAIERALEAEALARELVEAMNDLLYEYEDLILRLPCSTPVRGQPIHYNSQAAKQAENLLTKAKEVLGDE